MAVVTLPHLHFTSLSPRDQLGDIVDSYRLAAEKLGYPTSYADRCFLPGVINVLFFFWDVPWEVIAPYHPDCIVVNFEPLVPGTHAWRDNYFGVLRHCYLWEYSRSNFQNDRELGFKVADYVPLAYEEHAAPTLPLEDILPDAQQDIDVVFFGTMTPRRTAVLDTLIARGLRVKLTNGGEAWSTEERSGYLRRAKLALNFHNWDNSRVVEMGRLSTLFRQRKAVVCELYPDSEIDPLLRNAVVGASYAALVDTVIALLADPPRRAALEREGLHLFSRQQQAALVGPALDRYLQWRSQQKADPHAGAANRISVCLLARRAADQLSQTLEALRRSAHPSIELLVLGDEDCREPLEALTSVQGMDASVVCLPADSGTPAAYNLAMQLATGDSVVFCAAGDLDAPERLGRLSDFLASHPEIDVVGHASALTSPSGGSMRFAELDHEIKADLLGPRPMGLRTCMFRKRFIDHSGVRFDSEFVVYGDLQFLCKCALAGARFAAIPDVLQTSSNIGEAVEDLHQQRLNRLASQARAPLFALLFPHLTQAESQLLGQLYGFQWPPEEDYAHRMLATLGKACAPMPGALDTGAEVLARVLRREALRLVQVFFQGGFIDRDWIERQFTIPEVATFLSPISAQLPHRTALPPGQTAAPPDSEPPPFRSGRPA